MADDYTTNLAHHAEQASTRSTLAEQLAAAVRASFPPSGKPPEPATR